MLRIELELEEPMIDDVELIDLDDDSGKFEVDMALVAINNVFDALESLSNLMSSIEEYGISAPTMKAVDPHCELSSFLSIDSYDTLPVSSEKGDVADSALEGMTTAIRALWEKLKEMITKIINYVKSFFKSTKVQEKKIDTGLSEANSALKELEKSIDEFIKYGGISKEFHDELNNRMINGYVYQEKMDFLKVVGPGIGSLKGAVTSALQLGWKLLGGDGVTDEDMSKVISERNAIFTPLTKDPKLGKYLGWQIKMGQGSDNHISVVSDMSGTLKSKQLKLKETYSENDTSKTVHKDIDNAFKLAKEISAFTSSSAKSSDMLAQINKKIDDNKDSKDITVINKMKAINNALQISKDIAMVCINLTSMTFKSTSSFCEGAIRSGELFTRDGESIVKKRLARIKKQQEEKANK